MERPSLKYQTFIIDSSNSSEEVKRLITQLTTSEVTSNSVSGLLWTYNQFKQVQTKALEVGDDILVRSLTRTSNHVTIKSR